MLARINRVGAAKDFTHTVRSGTRSGCRNLVLYVLLLPEPAPSRFGFIVSKSVGNAVTRNRVKRRLRESAAVALRSRPSGLTVVVRALPVSAQAKWADLDADFRRTLNVAAGSAASAGIESLERGSK